MNKKTLYKNIIEELCAIAFFDPSQLWNEKSGDFIEPKLLSAQTQKAIEKIEKISSKDGTKFKYSFYGKMEALKILLALCEKPEIEATFSNQSDTIFYYSNQ